MLRLEDRTVVYTPGLRTDEPYQLLWRRRRPPGRRRRRNSETARRRSRDHAEQCMLVGEQHARTDPRYRAVGLVALVLFGEADLEHDDFRTKPLNPPVERVGDVSVTTASRARWRRPDLQVLLVREVCEQRMRATQEHGRAIVRPTREASERAIVVRGSRLVLDGHPGGEDLVRVFAHRGAPVRNVQWRTNADEVRNTWFVLRSGVTMCRSTATITTLALAHAVAAGGCRTELRRLTAAQDEVDVVSRLIEARGWSGAYTLRGEAPRRSPLTPSSYRAFYRVAVCGQSLELSLNCDEGPRAPRATTCVAVGYPAVDTRAPSYYAPELVALRARMTTAFTCQIGAFEITRGAADTSGGRVLVVRACGSERRFHVDCRTSDSTRPDRCRIEDR